MTCYCLVDKEITIATPEKVGKSMVKYRCLYLSKYTELNDDLHQVLNLIVSIFCHVNNSNLIFDGKMN